MKKILIAVFFIGLIITFILGSPFKKDFVFNGETFSHIKKMSGGEITNHFYTPNGEDLNTSQVFIQILEISENIEKKDWSDKFKPIYNQYELTPMQGEEFDLTGKGQKSGMFFNSYASAISVKGKEHMALYIRTTSADQDEESDSQKIDIIYALENIKFD